MVVGVEGKHQEQFLLEMEIEMELVNNFNNFQAKLSQFKLSFDRAATYVFPLLFLSFNIFYWAVYLLIMPAFIQVDRDRQK